MEWSSEVDRDRFVVGYDVDANVIVVTGRPLQAVGESYNGVSLLQQVSRFPNY
jgi:hypothetical protein